MVGGVRKTEVTYILIGRKINVDFRGGVRGGVRGYSLPSWSIITPSSEGDELFSRSI